MRNTQLSNNFTPHILRCAICLNLLHYKPDSCLWMIKLGVLHSVIIFTSCSSNFPKHIYIFTFANSLVLERGAKRSSYTVMYHCQLGFFKSKNSCPARFNILKVRQCWAIFVPLLSHCPWDAVTKDCSVYAQIMEDKPLFVTLCQFLFSCV